MDRRRIAEHHGRWWIRVRVFVIPLVVLAAVTVPHLDQGDFRTDTGWYAAIGLGSVRHWLHAHGLVDALTLQAEPGKPFFNKPPLALWIHGLFLWIFGVNLPAARAPTILASGLCVLFTTIIANRLGTRAQATIAGCVLALTVEFFRRTREISLDIWQLAFMLGAVCVVVGAFRARGRKVTLRRAAGAGALVGCALLCKPLVALLVPVIVGVWLATQRLPWARSVIVMMLTAIAVAAPWHVVMAYEYSDAFTHRYFVGEVAERALSGDALDHAKNVHGRIPPWFYLEQILRTYWPWTALFVLALVALARRELGECGRRAAVLALLWFGAWLVLLSVFPDRRPRYAVTLWPAMAWMVSLALTTALERRGRLFVRVTHSWGAVAAVLGGGVFAAIPMKIQQPPEPQWAELFGWIESNGKPEIWQGGFLGPNQARLYLQFGQWPTQTLDRQRNIVARPPAGGLIIYHRRDRLVPGPNESVELRAGDIAVTRLTSEPWSPTPVEDPGEATSRN